MQMNNVKNERYAPPHPSWVEVDLKQLKQNITLIRKHVGHALFCLVVKANAYGHGLVAVGKAAEEAGVDYLAVAHLGEGVELRKAGVQLPILVLGAIHEDQIPHLIRFGLEFSISSSFKADLVAAKYREIGQEMGLSCRVHLEVDTGMRRTGMRPATAAALFQRLQRMEGLEVVGIYSHLATADKPDDPFALQQIEEFHQLMSSPPFLGIRLLRHLANSGGTAHFPRSHLDMVRPSLLAFGYPPEEAPEGLRRVAPCLSVKTKVSYFKVVEEGMGISYGHSHIASRKTRIVTIPIGYGDGYRRCLSNRASVLIRERRFPIVGTICMDQCMVDVGHETIYVGDEVVLIGRQGDQEITLQELAHLCDTNLYEMLCLFNERLPRVYLDGPFNSEVQQID